MSIRLLKEILPPPTSPIEIPSQADWSYLQSRLGGLPEDYREFMETYGTGLIDDFLWVFSPCTSNKFLHIEIQAHEILSALAESAKKFPEVFNMPRYPESGGFLPFAGTDNGDSVFWVTNGDPNAWTTAVMGPRSPDCFYYDGGMTDFLFNLLGKKIRCSIFPSDFPSIEQPLRFTARAS